MNNQQQQRELDGGVFAGMRGARACVDIGGTKIAVSVADCHGIRGRVSQATVKQGASDAVARQVLELIDASCEQGGVAPREVTAVGVSSCGPFVMRDGCVELAAPNICGGLAGEARGLPNEWTSAELEAPLRRKFAAVTVANDAIAALVAERRWGALQQMEHCAYVTWSTGIGVGLCVDGHVLRGKHGNAGHAGHMFVSDNDDALCGCGNIGDVEGLVAGNAVPRRFAKQGFADASALFQAARDGDAAALRIAEELCRVMGRMLYNLVVTLDLQAIRMGGSVFSHHQEFLLPRLRAQIDGRLPALTTGFSLDPAGLGDKVGDYAALALVL